MAWYGMVWHGIMTLVWHWSGISAAGMAMTWYGVLWHIMAYYGMAWHISRHIMPYQYHTNDIGMAWYGIVMLHGMAWWGNGMACYDMLCHAKLSCPGLRQRGWHGRSIGLGLVSGRRRWHSCWGRRRFRFCIWRVFRIGVVGRVGVGLRHGAGER